MERNDGDNSTAAMGITPEMLAAGVEEFELIDFESATEGAEVWVADIYRAMEGAKAKTG